MKKIITLVSVATLLVFSGYAQSRKECTLQVNAEKNSKSRGINSFIIEPSQIIAIPENIQITRGANQCYLTVENSSNEDVNVFIDSVYVGFVSPQKKGVVARPKGYSIVHCWTVSGKNKWVERGDCKDCKMTFVLNKPRD